MKKLLPFILIVVFVIAALIAVPFLLQSNNRRQQLADYLSQKLNHKVVIGKLDASLFPPSFRLQEIAAFADGQEAPALQIDHADADVSLGSLFGGAFHPSALTLDHWNLILHRRPNGSWDADEWRTALAALSSGSSGSVSKVTLHNGECHWIDAYAPIPQELVMQTVEGTLDRDHQTARLSGTLSGAAIPVNFLFEGKGQFLSTTWSGDLRFTDDSRQWAIHLDDQPNHLTASGLAVQWRWEQAFGLLKFVTRLPIAVSSGAAPVFLQDWKIGFDWQPNGIVFTHAATLAGGPTEAKGQIAVQAGGLDVRASAAAKNIPLQALCAPIGGCPSIEGTLTAVVPRFEMLVATQSWTSMVGEGTVEIKEGRYHVPESSVQKLSRTHLLKYMKEKFPGIAQKGFVFLTAHVHGVMAGGMLSVDNALVDSGDVRAAFAGRVEPSKKGVEAYLRLQIREHSIDRLQYIPGKYIFGQPGHEQVQPIYGHLQGAWDDWILRAIPSYKIPAAARSQLSKSLATK